MSPSYKKLSKGLLPPEGTIFVISKRGAPTLIAERPCLGHPFKEGDELVLTHEGRVGKNPSIVYMNYTTTPERDGSIGIQTRGNYFKEMRPPRGKEKR